METAKVRDWMTLTPYVTTPDTSLIDAYQIMKNYEIRRLPVMDEDEQLVGVITLSDIRSLVTSSAVNTVATIRLLEENDVASVMTEEPLTISPDAALHEAAQLMFENKFGGLPVMNKGKLVGVISESDIFRFVMSTAREEFAT